MVFSRCVDVGRPHSTQEENVKHASETETHEYIAADTGPEEAQGGAASIKKVVRSFAYSGRTFSRTLCIRTVYENYEAKKVKLIVFALGSFYMTFSVLI